MKLSIDDDWVTGGDGVRFKGAYPVLEAELIGERVLVTYDWMAFDRNSAARNLFCYDCEGNLLWRAADIGWGAVDAYTGIISEDPLWVGNFACFNCRIDIETGEILEQEFTK